MNNIIRHMTIAALWGGVALGLAGEAGAQSCPLQEAQHASYKPYICNVTHSVGGAVQSVTWRLTFSEPVTGVSWQDFATDNTNDNVPNSSPVRRYGLGTVEEKISKVDTTNYEITLKWDCTSSGNDCHHNQTVNTAAPCDPPSSSCTATTWESSGATDRYVGEVWLELQSGAEFSEVHPTPTLPQTSRPHAIGKTHTTVSVQ
ncbi:MAG: hypothetical protein OXG54_07435 [Gammaproteobacteria bacterium]|nr:hypothetical protein [Gammaproteobacteria bacterium]